VTLSADEHAFRTLFSGSMRGFQSALLRPT
jgi:hypothetical protein